MNKDMKLDILFAQVRNEPSQVSFEETKTAFLENLAIKSNAKPSKGVHFLLTKKGIIMIGIVGLLVTSILMLNTSKGVKSVDTELELEQKAVVISNNNENQIEKNTEANRSDNKVQLTINELPFLKPNEFNSTVGLLLSINRNAPRSAKNNLLKEKFIFPKLTPKEIEQNNKRKKKMVKAARKLDDKVYAYIPSGSYQYDGETVSVQGFFMQTKEVTNGEYKTFLFDLLINDRRDEFLIAKPKQELWSEVMGKEYKFLQDMYFSDERYEDYPVVNVSRAGAEMFCKWLSTERGVLEGKNDPHLNDIRLPFRSEWMKAATVEGKFEDFAWVSSSTPSCFKGNFSTKDYNRIAVTKDKTGEKIPFGDTSAITTAGYLLNKGDITTKVGSYKANERGLYDLSGNVAEMVYVSSGGTYDIMKVREFGTAGGGWMNKEGEIKFTAEDPHKGETQPHVNIGFRVVMTYIGKNWQVRERKVIN